jgi:putative transposase
MLKSYKTEINPNEAQKQKINRTIGVCRYVYNLYIDHNKEIYEKEQRFVSGKEFSVWLNKEYMARNPEKTWIKEVSTKSVKQSIMDGERAFKRFFEGQSGFPQFKQKNRSESKMYFVKNDAKMVIECERHRIKIPTLGWVQVKEKGYLPTEEIIRSGKVSKRAGRYYVSVLVEVEVKSEQAAGPAGIGIDLGLTDFAVVSDGTVKKNVNKKPAVKKAEKKLRREQRRLSRKYESLKKRKNNKKEKGEATQKNIDKQVKKVQKLHQRLDNIRTDYINKTISELVKTKPGYITIENLNVTGMMKNRHLARAIAQQKFREFRVKLGHKCRQNGIELRVVDRFYPSSKLCHRCGAINSALKLSERVYDCGCGYTADRDYNASLNLRDAVSYTSS